MLKSNKGIKNDSKSDLCVNRGIVVLMTLPKNEIDDVFRIDMSLCAIPKADCEVDEYDAQRNRIVSYINRICKRYVNEHDNLFEKNSIVDVNFTSANLRKGYNKLIQVTMYVKSRNKFRYETFRERVRDTIKPTIRLMSDKFRSEGYKCYKKKQTVNNRLKKIDINGV